MINSESVGKIFVDEKGEIWQLISYCQYPTATMKKVGTEETVGGATNSLNLSKFKLADPEVEKTVKKVMRQSASSALVHPEEWAEFLRVRKSTQVT